MTDCCTISLTSTRNDLKNLIWSPNTTQNQELLSGRCSNIAFNCKEQLSSRNSNIATYCLFGRMFGVLSTTAIKTTTTTWLEISWTSKFAVKKDLFHTWKEQKICGRKRIAQVSSSLTKSNSENCFFKAYTPIANLTILYKQSAMMTSIMISMSRKLS